MVRDNLSRLRNLALALLTTFNAVACTGGPTPTLTSTSASMPQLTVTPAPTSSQTSTPAPKFSTPVYTPIPRYTPTSFLPQGYQIIRDARNIPKKEGRDLIATDITEERNVSEEDAVRKMYWEGSIPYYQFSVDGKKIIVWPRLGLSSNYEPGGQFYMRQYVRPGTRILDFDFSFLPDSNYCFVNLGDGSFGEDFTDDECDGTVNHVAFWEDILSENGEKIRRSVNITFQRGFYIGHEAIYARDNMRELRRRWLDLSDMEKFMQEHGRRYLDILLRGDLLEPASTNSHQRFNSYMYGRDGVVKRQYAPRKLSL
ncbi:MAG: hypothetical protein HYW24_04135 [Candidatus Aenigmarchaeota archaeon]|nr:hypothetical protein [Candidatus Aenigmarchaeota archaeon]